MIFVSIALLVVAAIALGIGIASSSVGPLVISVLATLAAAGTLWASFVHYRKEAAEHGEQVTGLGGNQPRQPGYPGAYTPPSDTAPLAAPAAAAMAAPAATAAGPAVASAARPTVVPDGWDSLPADDAAAMVEAFNLEDLHDLRRHEVEHEHRATVLTAIDNRVDALVQLRRRISAG